VISWLADIFVALWSYPIVRILAVLGGVLGAVPLTVAAERKVIGWVQRRPGPNRAPLWGWTQGLVDGVKLFFKEIIRPSGVDTVLYYLAPFFSVVPALVLICILPFAPDGVNFLRLPGVNDVGQVTQLTIAANHPVGLLLYFAVSSLGVYGLVLAGWSSNNKYALLGGIRSSAQMVSYELSLALAAVGVLVMAGTLNLQEIVTMQLAYDAGDFMLRQPILGALPAAAAPFWDINLWHWNIWSQPIAFFIFLVAGFAETNRLPFDLPEAESELTGGYHTEYSSMKFAMFFLAEYVHMIVISTLTVTLFLGGWSNPLTQGPTNLLLFGLNFGWLVDHLTFVLKVASFLFFFIFIRATLPRLRFDQLMTWGWKYMLPLALANVVILAAARGLFGKGLGLTLILLAINVGFVALLELNSNARTPLSAERRRGFRYVT